MPLTDRNINNAVSLDNKPFKLWDADNMFLLIKNDGRKIYYLKYRYEGKDNVMQLGEYPETSLNEARDIRDAARTLLSQGAKPAYALKKAMVATLPSAGKSNLKRYISPSNG